ncbi:FecR protein [Chryseobacterium sp. 52]|nr:FecR protein [Chryseobacterium sp. 52]
MTDSEKKQLYDFFETSSDEELQELIADKLQNIVVSDNLDYLQPDMDRIFLAVRVKTAETKIIPLQSRNRWLRYSGIAAIVIAILLAGIYLIQRNFLSNTEILTDVLPGRSSATLTLADGRKVRLSTVPNDTILQDAGGTRISKTSEGKLIYTIKDNKGSTGTVGFNTLSTARGETYQVVLPDGSHVWLNAGSSIEYPNSFQLVKQRRIRLIGEAYFEVAHNRAKPFIVSTEGQEVTVLGTQFNINSYADEGRTITTLAQGSVRLDVPKSKKTMLLTPGHQIINAMGRLSSQPADLEVALAWKEGRIYFKNAPLQQVLREISRWYNIEIEYHGNPGTKVFSGGIKRTAPLSEVLRVLELSNLHFTLKKENGITTLITAQEK